jgi:hypothetical protein
MKKILVVVLSVVCSVGFAGTNSRGLNFNSPTVNDKANVSNPQMGELVFDTSDSTFYGNIDGTGSGWTPLSIPTGSNQVLSNGTENIQRATVSISSASACSVTLQSGSWITGASASGSVCTLTLSGFTGDPSCVATRNNSSATDQFVSCGVLSSSSVACGIYDVSTGVTTGSFHVICMGPR